MRRLVLALALPLAASLAPAPAAACGSCPRDGSVQRTLRGAFVRFHPVTFTLHVRVGSGEEGRREEGRREEGRVERLRVMPMALPLAGEEPVAWSSLRTGDALELTVREKDDRRVVAHVRVLRGAPGADPARR